MVSSRIAALAASMVAAFAAPMVAPLAASTVAPLAASTVAPPGALASEPSGPPLCAVAVELDPPRAVPGQQVVHRLRLLVRSDVVHVEWEEPPRFPRLRAERLASPPPPPPVRRDGASYEVRDELRALFAEAPGSVALPRARVTCRARVGGAELSRSVATPGATLEVVPLPEAARAPGLRGVVGPLAVRRSVTPERVGLGQAVRLVVTLQGEGNLWDAPEPELSSEALGGAEIFRRPPELRLDRGARLGVRRYFTVDLVPRSEGVLRIPSLAWSWFDPASGALAVAATEAVEIPVGPRAAPAEDLAPERAAPGAPEAEPAPPRSSRALGVSLAVALLAAAGAIGWRWHRRRRRVAHAVAAALAQADSARAGGDRDGELAALARALRAATGREPTGAAAELLSRIERARFDPTAAAPDLASVLRAIGRPVGRASGLS